MRSESAEIAEASHVIDAGGGDVAQHGVECGVVRVHAAERGDPGRHDPFEQVEPVA